MAKSYDAVVALLPSLSDREKQKLKQRLKMEEQTACERLGHLFKQVTKEQGWFSVEKKMICTRCGKELT